MSLQAPTVSVAAAILAGGRARRLNGVVKAALVVGERSLLTRVRETLGLQARACVLCIAPDHENATWVRDAGLPVAIDPVTDSGPLAAIAAALAWAKVHAPEAEAVVSVPVDVPFLPRDLVARLKAASDGKTIAVAESGMRQHHAIALWPLALAETLMTDVTSGGGAWAIHRWQARHPVVTVRWPVEPFDPFFNVNTDEDLRMSARIAVLADQTFARMRA